MGVSFMGGGLISFVVGVWSVVDMDRWNVVIVFRSHTLCVECFILVNVEMHDDGCDCGL